MLPLLRFSADAKNTAGGFLHRLSDLRNRKPGGAPLRPGRGFNTPLTIYLAEAVQLGQQSPLATMQARALDIALGSIVGLAGGAALHVPAFRSRVTRVIKVVLRSGECVDDVP